MVIAVDVGTSSARASAYAVDGRAVSALYHQIPYEPRVTADGGVEHDPGVLLAAVATCLDAICARAGRAPVRAVGVTTFWHGLCGFDAAGRAVTPVYTWADSRSARDAGLLRDALDEAGLHARTGCHLHSSYWPATARPATSAPTASSRTGSRSTSAPPPRCASPPAAPSRRRPVSGATASTASACCSVAPPPRGATCTCGAVRSCGCPTMRRWSSGWGR